MLKFLAAIRLALQPGAQLGEIAILAIQEDFIPEMDKLIAKARRPQDKEELQEIRDLWVKYSDPQSSDSKFWRNIAGNMLKSAAHKLDAYEGYIDDVESAVVLNLIKNDNYHKFVNSPSVNITLGPKKFAGFWSGLCYKAALREFVRIFKKSPERHWGQRVEEQEDEEGEKVSVIEQIKSPMTLTNLDIRDMGIYKRGLDRYIEQRFGENKYAMAIYEAWIDAIEKKGDDLVFTRDVQRPLAESLKVSESYIWTEWKQLKDAIAMFFTRLKQEKFESPHLRHSMKIAERLAIEDYTHKIASWVLELRDTP